ncbi:winged helix-turn-helix domain-containing protein [Streptomyces sp. NPDC093105]|uniref:winged helix-turn-helix domain-containing protein n=1 Tax=Streptomyces sp. NPDC093105 TaxID=3366029 RepID=UPI00380406CC
MVTTTVPTLRDTIAEDLRIQITTGHLKPGDRLPSEPKLATHYKVSTPTLRNALALLQTEGLIDKRHGKGNFVRRSLSRLTYEGGVLTPTLHLTIRKTQLQAKGCPVTDLWHESGRLRSDPGSHPLEEAPASVHPCDRTTQQRRAGAVLPATRGSTRPGR